MWKALKVILQMLSPLQWLCLNCKAVSKQLENISEVFNLCTLIATRVLMSCLHQAEPVASSTACFPSTRPNIISAP